MRNNFKICGEKVSSDSSSAEQFINGFISITEDYAKHQFFDFDEIGLYFRIFSEHTLASVNDRPDGTKKAKTG